ncbi:MAG: glutathione S-transferase N-terminal domain-containing protein [Candidatus Omnitrophica bacterium]|nr:glutathione S-transferase N-terminal domain-containing protein [Candidatus Omnitrophota bacterium]
MPMKIIRKILGGIILFFDALTRPRQMQRSPEAQQQFDDEAASLQFFEFRTCPFCVKVRRNVHRLNLNIALRDAQNDPKYTQELIEGGGKRQVPCLRIQENGEVRWMYESKAINAYLNERFEKVS